MGIFDASFNTQYQASPSLLLQMEHLLSGASHANIAKDIGTELTTLQNTISTANSNDYARKLEMMTPEEVLAMEAQGLDPRTARFGNGFIYNPEDEAIKDAFKNLKTKTSSTITGKVKRSNDRLTDKEKKELRKKGPISVEDLLALAGVNSAYTDLGAIQEQANALNSAFDSQAQKEAMDFLRGAPVSDSRVKALWNGDNSFFTDNGYSEADAALFGDALRNSAEGHKAMTDRLKDLYEHEQAENALNGNPVTNAVDWLMQQGYGNAGISLSDVNPESKEFAEMRDNQRAIQNKVDFADAKTRIATSLRSKERKVNPDDLQALFASGTSEEINAWLKTTDGKQAIGSLNRGFLDSLKQTENWKELSNPFVDEVKRNAIERTVLEGINQELEKYNLQDIPELNSSMQNALQSELNRALSSELGVQTQLAEKALGNTKTNLDTALSAGLNADLAGILQDYLDSGDASFRENLGNHYHEFMTRINSGLKRILNDAGLDDKPENNQLRQELTNLLLNYVMNQEVDTSFSNMTLADYLKAGKGASNLTTKGKGELIGSKREMVADDPIMELLLGNGSKGSSQNKTDLSTRQQDAINMLREMVAYRQAAKKQKDIEGLKKHYSAK